MSDTLLLFVDPLTDVYDLVHDTAGWTVRGVPALHPGDDRPGQAFSIPPGTPNGNGVVLRHVATGETSKPRGILYLKSGGAIPWQPDQTAALMMDDFQFKAGGSGGGGNSLHPVHIVDDHLEQDGKRWFVRGVDGFCDHYLLLTGKEQQLRDCCQQTRDLGGNLRRVFGCMKNIVLFDPNTYGEAFHATLLQLFAIYAEYGLFGEYDVLPDTGYWGKSLAWCQAHWARVCDELGPVTNRIVSLTNEWDHGGNLVGSPNDYARPGIELVSQGSAVSDAPPPRPGWGIREFHCLKAWPKIFLFEDQLFNREGVDAGGATWGPRKPTYLSECFRFSETDTYTDERLARTLAYESLAFGSGMVLHNDSGKYSQVMTPRIAACAQVALTILKTA